jgi:hypothetical protein
MKHQYPIEFFFLYGCIYESDVVNFCCLGPNKYMSHACFHKSYTYRYYFAEPICNKMLPNEVVVAINNKYILVVDPNSKEFLEEFPYNKVVTWGASDKAFSVVYGDLVHNRKVFFKTNQVIEKKH